MNQNIGNPSDSDMWKHEVLKLWRRKHLLTRKEEETILNITKKISL